jgi:hypothetical protein
MYTRDGYLAVGMGLGAALGIVIGMLLFPDNVGIGIPLGLTVGFGCGMFMAQTLDGDGI